MTTQSLKKILMIRLSALGDVVMAIPTLQALKKKYPDAEIDWLVEAPAVPILQGHPDLNKIIVSPRQLFLHNLKRGKLLTAGRIFIKFFKELRSTHYDAVLDLHGLFKSGIAVGIARGKRKIGFNHGREIAHWFLNEKLPAYDPERHAVLRYLDLAAHVGAEYPPIPLLPYYSPTPEGTLEATSILEQHGLSEKKFIALTPGTSRAIRCWPVAHWQKLAQLIGTKTDFKMIIIGGKSDAPIGAEIATAGPGIINLCGQTSLPGLIAIIAQARGIIIGDTGPMHMAVAVGVGGVAIFGPSRPHRTGPFGANFTVVTPPRDCLGCLKRQCELPCLDPLEPEVVWEQLQKYLQLSN